jgi:CheY-specific phosphatase CheX
MRRLYLQSKRKILHHGQFVERAVLFCRQTSVNIDGVLHWLNMTGGILMTLMKSAPLPTFSNTVRNVIAASVKDACTALGIEVSHEAPVVRKSPILSGDYMAGIRVSGGSFQGTVTLCMDRKMGKAFAEKVFAGTSAKSDESMLCDLVGEVCNQVTGVIQRSFGQLGCKMLVSAQETGKSVSLLDAAQNPDEWLLIPFNFKDGRGVLGFGISGELKLAQDELEDLGDARSITFF